MREERWYAGGELRVYIVGGGCPFRVRGGGWKGEERTRSNDGFASTLVSSPNLLQPPEKLPGLRPQNRYSAPLLIFLVMCPPCIPP